ncbi:MAG: hypothetical protein ACI9U2_000627 [Bradymonadia bacterium]|jgi:hypothetical protein
MRLRDISDLIRDLIEGDAERFLDGNLPHALVQDVGDVQLVYRAVEGTSRKADLVPWLVYSFDPYAGLIDPFNVYPGRYWAMQRMHRQPSGLPELVTHVTRKLPSASEAIAPDLYMSFSHSSRVESIIKKGEESSLTLFHRGGLMETDRSKLPRADCIAGISTALPEGFVEDNIPGVVDLDGDPVVFLGQLVFYNGFRTVDRAKLRTFLFNCTAVATAARYVRNEVRKLVPRAAV